MSRIALARNTLLVATGAALFAGAGSAYSSLKKGGMKPPKGSAETASSRAGLTYAGSFPEPNDNAIPAVSFVARQGANALWIAFNKRMNGSRASITTQHLGPLINWRMKDEGYSLTVPLPPGLGNDAVLYVAGFRDALHPELALSATVVKIPASPWPASRQGLLFAWKSNATMTMAEQAGTLLPRGLAWWNSRGTMMLRGGWFLAPEAGRSIVGGMRTSKAWTVVLVLAPEAQTGGDTPKHVVSLQDAGKKVLALDQHGSLLVLRAQDDSSDTTEVPLCRIPAIGNPTQIVVKFDHGQVWSSVNGGPLWHCGELACSLPVEAGARLRFGSRNQLTSWRGDIERAAIFDRTLTEEEIAKSYDSFMADRHMWPAVEEREVLVRLLSPKPSPAQNPMEPREDALVCHQYEVLDVLNGPPVPARLITVTHWHLMNGVSMPAQTLKQGAVVRLALHRYEDHPEIFGVFVRGQTTRISWQDAFHDGGDWSQPVEIAGK